ncbi:MAG: carbamoyl-phosphate synthase large subunit, partial [Hydrogenophaga sp.]|uniref:carbamoyl-phosphate synthase large subunit n=1 Tax=Hydrogenophaga sp. TaxID=1904254 RepID=UPI00271D0F37
AVGYTLDELRNEITGGATPASFEPSIDYVVTKIPRFAFEKFPTADSRLTTQMKSVGEVMAMGRTFQESFQKALRGLEVGVDGMNEKTQDRETLERELGEPGPERIWYVGDAFAAGWTLAEVHQFTKIDPWFLVQIEEIVKIELKLEQTSLDAIDADTLRGLKKKGFSDRRLAKLLKTTDAAVRARRIAQNIRPVYKRVDTCAAEFSTDTAYLYSTYEGHGDGECEAEPTNNKKIMVLGGGPNRIGQGIEFDYCCVHAALAMREDGYETIMVNCNPETVSTDYDTSDRLYFEPLTLEDVLEIVDKEKPTGEIVQYGGQTPLKLALGLEAAGVPIIGTSPDMIDAAEDRERFQKLLHELKLRQPPNATARAEPEALEKAAALGYPLVVRPSYVLGGRAMEIVHEQRDLERYMREAVKVSNDSPVLLDRFLNDAIECDVDAIRDHTGRVFIGGVMEHIEQAGVHSGDSACSLPPYYLKQATIDELKRQTAAMAQGLNVIGLMNVQFAIQEVDGQDVIYVLEVNPRASRTVPFVSKATGIQLAKVAARCMAGQSLDAQGIGAEVNPPYFSVKEAVFPFVKFPGVDTILGPEMKSTGEVMGVGKTFGEAFVKSQLGAGTNLPRPKKADGSPSGKVFLTVKNGDKPRAVEIARALVAMGFELVATRGTASAIAAAGVPVVTVNKVTEGRPHIVDMIKNGDISLVINTVEERRNAIADSRAIRTSSLLARVTTFTTIFGAEAAVEGMKYMDSLGVISVQEMHAQLTA